MRKNSSETIIPAEVMDDWVRSVELKDGSIVAIRGDGITPMAASHLQQSLRKAGHRNITVVLLKPGVTIEVYYPEQAKLEILET